MIVNWTETALADLQAIETYIARSSPRYGRAVVGRIFASTGWLADFPRLGAIVPEFEDESLRELLESPYRIVYRVYTDRVDVVAVVHGARQMPQGL
ncbi:type II toxin-antitoxin system RelE/ParE family toxin [Fimbriiglobus ruber]|uniref:type II toxin-antitoxin system RelE/ParE family toxin n=1 Tax=Fimbriiglobus ruber TaxID=1908690 RepID=UPI000B4B181E